MAKNLILIGFKSVGKTTIGKKLSKLMCLPFLDLDQQIERYFIQKNRKKLSCREIMRLRGENFFRKLENMALKKTLTTPTPAIIALGGGAPLQKTNQILLKKHFIIQILAPKKVVFERIKKNGRPSFFPKNQDMNRSFNQIWKERIPIYKKLADITIRPSRPERAGR